VERMKESEERTRQIVGKEEGGERWRERKRSRSREVVEKRQRKRFQQPLPHVTL
jgi:hypothetical protein